MHNIFGCLKGSVNEQILFGLPTHEHATYNFPWCVKHGFSKFIPTAFKLCPCALFIVIANADRMGNFNLLNSVDKSVVIICCGINIFSPWNFPLIILS